MGSATIQRRPTARPERVGACHAAVPMPGAPVPEHEAAALTAGGATARIGHLGQIYTLRITRQGKLILTK